MQTNYNNNTESKTHKVWSDINSDPAFIFNKRSKEIPSKDLKAMQAVAMYDVLSHRIEKHKQELLANIPKEIVERLIPQNSIDPSIFPM